MDIKGVDKRMAVMVGAAIVLFGGFALPTVYAKTLHFSTDFESSLIPACTNEEVAFSGTANFVFHEVDGRQTVTMKYVNVKGVGLETGTKYIVTEHDKFVTIVNEQNGDTTFDTTINGRFTSTGPGINTMIKIKLVTVLHANGDGETLLDQAVVKCPPDST